METDLMSQDDLQELLEARHDPAVSIFLPMARVGADVRGNPTRLKNALSAVADELESRGWRQPDIDALLAEPTDLLQDTPFWQHQREGLALFIAPGTFRSFRLPLSFEPLTTISDRFQLRPLLPFFSEDGRFYILAVSQGQVRLLRATRHTVEEMELGDAIPSSLEVALQYDDPEEHIQSHTVTSAAGGAPAAEPGVTHHGQGGVEDEMEQRLRRFLRQVSQGLQQRLQGVRAPLVFAGVDYLYPIYAEVDVTDKLTLLEEAVAGNPDHLSAQELQEAAWEVVEPLFQRRREEAVERYGNALSAGQASDDTAEIVRSAVQGRVDTLFVSRDARLWGLYHADRHEVTLNAAGDDDALDLLDFASSKTLATGGMVYVVPSEAVPGEGPAAAIYRY